MNEEQKQDVSAVESPDKATEQVEKQETIEVGSIEYTKNVRKQIDKLTREKYDAIRRADIIESKYKQFEAANKLRELDAERPNRPVESQYENDVGEVDNAKFNASLIEYENKLLDWGMKKNAVVSQSNVPNSTETDVDKIQAAYEAKYATYRAQAEELRGKYADFDEVTERNVFTQPMREAILEADNQAEVAYMIGNNKELAERIKGITGNKLVMEIAKLDLQLNNAKASRSNAPEPISPVSNTNVSGRQEMSKSDSNMSAAEYFDRYLSKNKKAR